MKRKRGKVVRTRWFCDVSVFLTSGPRTVRVSRHDADLKENIDKTDKLITAAELLTTSRNPLFSDARTP